eukprot:CAMPEP_0176016494 /NCGR_PEP_ID=MMETSP0120_2-20121206/7879_1 /TAXON_ID=160619 /ORGANISM="Kryptoperidinium foliaceum, Strain CCMP 1326" /LENGTH=94 /DNA_ID=CAMNT_0017349491 /DNA_START=66 /DNA_END=347 /DNA_ORIENTATION=-
MAGFVHIPTAPSSMPRPKSGATKHVRASLCIRLKNKNHDNLALLEEHRESKIHAPIRGLCRLQTEHLELGKCGNKATCCDALLEGTRHYKQEAA